MILKVQYYFLSFVGLSLLLTACMTPSSNTVDHKVYGDAKVERNVFADNLVVAQNRRVDVLAPQNFAKAQQMLKQAQEGREGGPLGNQVAAAVSEGEGYLQTAVERAKRSEIIIPDVVKARDMALQAGARSCPAMLNSLDDKLKTYTSQIEDDIYMDRTGLNFLKSQYQDLEKKSLRLSELDQAKQLLAEAQKKGGKSTKAYKEAVEKVNLANQMIGMDCRPGDTVQPSQDALIAAQNAVKVAKTKAPARKQVKKATSISEEIEQRNKEQAEVGKNVAANAGSSADASSGGLATGTDASAMAGASSSGATSSQQQPQQQTTDVNTSGAQPATVSPAPAVAAGTAIGAVVSQTGQPQDKLKIGLEQARSELANSKADVYLQGNELIISLKNIQFPSGRSELPPESFEALGKVKDVIDRVQGQKVVIEDHTGNADTPQKNKVLSQGRAEAVAQYLVSAKGLPAYKVDPIGYGEDKAAGGSKHVDIIIQAQ